MKFINKIIKVLYCFSGKFVKITKYDSIIRNLVLNFIFDENNVVGNTELTLCFNKFSTLLYYCINGAFEFEKYIYNINNFIKLIIEKNKNIV